MLKIHADNGWKKKKKTTFKTKCQILAIFRKIPQVDGIKRCVDLNSASIYSSYNILL